LGCVREQLGKAPRVKIVADDPGLTPFAGSAVVGELVCRLELIAALDRAIEMAPKVGGLGPIKPRARGSPGQLLVAVAESMLCGGDWMLDLERLRADEAGAELRAVAEVPAASTACQLARRFRRSPLRGAEAAFAACANALDLQLGRSPEGAVTPSERWRHLSPLGQDNSVNRGVGVTQGRVRATLSYRHRIASADLATITCGHNQAVAVAQGRE